MATIAQINAAVSNAQHSTGPRTPQGKAVSSRNALKLVLFAQAEILPGEDPEALAQLARDFEAAYEPEGPVEIMLVNDLVRAIWLERRYARIEAEVINIRYAALSPEDRANALGAIFLHDAEGANVLQKIERRRAAARRQAERARKQIEEHISRNLALEPQPDPDPAPAGVIPNPVTAILADPVRFDGPAPAVPAPLRNTRDDREDPALRL
jgi:hypothetical protein